MLSTFVCEQPPVIGSRTQRLISYRLLCRRGAGKLFAAYYYAKIFENNQNNQGTRFFSERLPEKI